MSTEIFRWKPQLTSAPLWMRSQPQHPLLLKWECVCDSLALINSYCWVVVVFIMLLSCSSKWTLVSLIFFCVWVFPPTGFIYSTSISKNLPHPKSCSDRVLWWDFISLILNRSMALLIAVMMKLPCLCRLNEWQYWWFSVWLHYSTDCTHQKTVNVRVLQVLTKVILIFVHKQEN